MSHPELVYFYADRLAKICLGEEVPILRPTFGDRLDLGLARLQLAVFLAYSPEARLWLHELGKRVGRVLGSKLKEKGILSDFLIGRVKNPLGQFSISQPAEGKYIVRVSGNLFSDGLPNIGIRFDSFLAGILASLVSAQEGRPMNAAETECYANGANSCEFLVQRADMPSGADARISQTESWEDAMDPILREYSKRVFNVKGRKKLRSSMEDDVDVGVLRLISSAAFSYSPEVRPWLYSLGKKVGAVAAEEESKGFMGKVAGIMMPLMMALRGHVTIRDKEGMARIERRPDGSFYFYDFECPISHGMPTIGDVYDYFVAGVIAGRFEKMTGQTASAREIACPAKGDPYCLFEVRFLE